MLGKKLINAGPVSSGANTFASENFNTVLYTGNGGTQYIGGYINRGAVFNGSSSVIQASGLNQFFNNWNDASWSAWINTTDTSSQFIVCEQTNAQNYKILGSVSSSKFTITTRKSGTVYSASSTTSINDGNWHHVLATYDNSTGTVKGYVDGSEEISIATGGTSSGTFSVFDFCIGANKQGSSIYNPFNGKIDQVRFFNKALSSSEVTTLYGETFASTTISTTDIFDDNSGVALYQLDGNALNSGGDITDTHYFFVSDAGNQNSSARLNSVDSEFTYTRPSGYSEWGGTFDASNQSHQFAGSSSYTTLSESNKKWDKSGAYYNSIWSTNGYNSGKYYFELEFLGAELFFGITNLSTATTIHDGNEVKNNSILYGSWSTLSYKYSTTNTADGVILSINDVIGFAVDFDNRELKYYRNNSLVDTVTLSSVSYDGTATNVTYQEATKFTPDLVWIKRRSSTEDHAWFDSVRGVQRQISSNLTAVGYTTTNAVSSFDSTGFTTGNNGATNASGHTYVAWCFNAGTGSAVSNTDGDITSTVKANTAAGFSIVSYSGNNASSATIGHGLNSAPELIFTKARNFGAGWPTMVKTASASLYGLRLNSSSANDAGNGSVFYNNTAPTASVYTVGGSDEINDGYNYISYCFHSVNGYQKIGTYTGTGASGNLVETGFEPAFVMIKKTSGTGSWYMFDNKRLTLPYSDQLIADSNGAEAVGTYVKFLANGFQLDTTASDLNTGSQTFIYLAIAADPDQTDPTVENSFNVVTYTGNGSTQDLDFGFKPDLVWIKNRSNANPHSIQDTVTGDFYLRSNATDAAAATGGNNVSSFNSNGITVKDSSSGAYNVNGSVGGQYSGNAQYVAWGWKAGDHDENLPQINTEGSIDSVVSVNDAAGFSIVKYTGEGAARTVGHGLSSTPEMVIIKNLDDARNWTVYHTGLSSSSYISLNSSAAETTDTRTDGGQPRPFGPFNSTTFGVNIDNETGHTNNYIAYCWYSVAGYSKIGSYNGSNYPITITTGFQPRFLLIKRTNTSGNSWVIIDSAREIGSGADALFPDLSVAESSSWNTDFISTGFTISSNESYISASGGEYIYMAFK